MVRSVEKAFRVLEAFDGSNPLVWHRLAPMSWLDKSAAQRFTQTLNKFAPGLRNESGKPL
ncbi:MAG: helix-turn-helix domain-containing protein [Phyllobacterium sp.]|uniref:helix-turn-helix domain-containing protein n=1 Tax=Phyllobacterium sp. TaxID=1871046 RepID=UPI0030F2FE31